MEAKALTPRDLFDGRVCFEIPPFQRPYVWTEEDQWQPLWDDIVRVTEAVLDAGGDEEAIKSVSAHFLGAVVVSQQPSSSGDPTRSWVIDGQQRLTTLQLLLDAAQLAIEKSGLPDVAESLQELVTNDSKRFRETSKRFKLWPSRADRAAFERVMDNELSVPQELAESRIVLAHAFFVQAIGEWAQSGEDSAPVGSRLGALATVLQHHLQVVAIDLSGKDDDQLIFETLNDRGTPLLAADLIKNHVFKRCEDLGVDVDKWNELYWSDFDDDWWRSQVSQGRLYRSRVDLFFQYWLTMRMKEEIPADGVFGCFRGHAERQFKSRESAEDFLRTLRRNADMFRDFAQLDPRTSRGSFYTAVVETLELGAFTPLLLWLLSEEHKTSGESADRALRALESWAIRRTLLRRTMKDVNKLVVALLVELDRRPEQQVGEATARFLEEQTADARVWPTNKDLEEELPSLRIYGNIKQPRLRTVLGRIELHLRTARHEAVPLPTELQIEHVMPQGWRSHWADGVDPEGEAATRRDRLVNTIGNLTLVTQKLNHALSNRPWTDEAAREVAPRGKDAGLGKRSLLSRYSLLLLNKDVVDRHEQAWGEPDIERRNSEFARAIAEIWPIG
jgi:hypothetical protein